MASASNQQDDLRRILVLRAQSFELAIPVFDWDLLRDMPEFETEQRIPAVLVALDQDRVVWGQLPKMVDQFLHGHEGHPQYSARSHAQRRQRAVVAS